jgi:hypothetical protein
MSGISTGWSVKCQLPYEKRQIPPAPSIGELNARRAKLALDLDTALKRLASKRKVMPG